MLTVLFFARLKDQLGTAQHTLTLEQAITIGQLKEKLVSENPDWQSALMNANIISAVNHDVVDNDYLLNGNEEVAFFPPVTGG